MDTANLNIVVAVRCYNEAKNIERFLKGYDFADAIVVSDGGSTDGSQDMLRGRPKVQLLSFEEREARNGEIWNPDAPHMNFVLNAAKRLNPDWLIFDDMDDVPNYLLREQARAILESSPRPQVHAFRLYLWGEKQHFPYMSREFNPAYRSLWAWKPGEVDIHADTAIRHGTLKGLLSDPFGIDTPFCLLHRSWNPDTIQKKVDRYNKLGLPMTHPMQNPDGYGYPSQLPEWARE